MSKILTVVIPAYNSERTIMQALGSLNYFYSNLFNVIIVDDGSKKPISKYIDYYLNKYPTVIKCIRKENGNWGSVINFIKNKIMTKYVKILDSDDDFLKKNFGPYLELLDKCSKAHADVVISSFVTIDTNGYEKLFSFSVSDVLRITSFNKISWGKILSMHALTFSRELFKIMPALPTNISYTDNILVFQTILKSKKVAILPRQIYLYRYQFNNDNQSMSYANTAKQLETIKFLYHQLTYISLHKIHKRRRKHLVNVIKSLLYFILLIISIDNNLYTWQKKEQYKIEISYLKDKHIGAKFRRQINSGYLFLMNKNNARFIFLLNKIIFSIAPVGFLKLYRKQFRLQKK